VTEEIWKSVVGFEGSYEVSNLGRVRSMDRTFVDEIGRVRFCRGRVLHGSNGAKKYRLFILYQLSVGTPRYLHDLVAEAFVGPKPEGAQVRHLDDDPSNNTESNLAYGTPLQNAQDAKANGKIRYAERHAQCVYPSELIARVKASRRQMDSVRAEAVFGISARYIREIWAGEKRTQG